jgi:hypothetical protein
MPIVLATKEAEIRRMAVQNCSGTEIPRPYLEKNPSGRNDPSVVCTYE